MHPTFPAPRQKQEQTAIRRGLSIQVRLLILVAAAALTPLLYSTYHTRAASRLERANAEQSALQLARRIATRVDDHVNTVDALLAALTQGVRTDVSAAAHNDAVLAAVSEQLGARFLQLSVADSTGRVVGLSMPGGSTGRSLSARDRKYFREAMASRGLGIGEPMIGRATGQYAIAIGRAVVDPEGRAVGVVTASTLLDQLRELLIPADLPRGAAVALLDSSGTVLVNTLGAERWLGSGGNLMMAMQRQGQREGVRETVGVDSVERLSGFASASRVPWSVYVGIPSAVALQHVRAQERNALWLGLGSLALSLVLAWFLARGIAGPVRALTHDADAFAAGDLSRRTGVRTDGEIGTLATTFNRMADALQHRSNELGASERRYRSLFDTLPLPMWVYDVETLRFLAVNQAAIAQYGYSREEFLELTIMDVRPPEEAERLRRIVVTRREGMVESEGWRHTAKSGEILDVEINSDSLVYADRHARLVVVNDVTNRRRMEAELRASQEQLRQSQKMEAVGSLAGGIAHDFNNLLTAILGYCDLALDGIPAGSAASGDVAEIRRAADRAAELTHQLLAFSRRQVLKPHVFSLSEAVEETEKILRRLISENIVLELSLPTETPNVRADPTQLEQVIINLAVNARDAMPRGGRLSLATGEVLLALPLSTAGCTLPAGRYATLSVSDTGTGVPEDIRERVFEPFFTTKARGQGTGLGLATVYGIVQQSGGGITVESVEGVGSTFRLYFPAAVAAPAAEVEDESSRPSHASERGEGTILLAEDDDAVRAIAREALERAGYRVLAAADGNQAITLAETHIGPIDLLVTDVIMPGMNGRELAERLGDSHPGMPVLFTSGYTDNVLAKQGVLIAGTALLDKPFTPAALTAKVALTLASHAVTRSA